MAILGDPGTGKTFLAERLASYYDNVIYFDVSGFLKPQVEKFYKTDDLKKVVGRKGHTLVFPKPNQQNKVAYNWFFDQVYKKNKDTVIIVDEAFLVGKMHSMTYPDRLMTLIVTGRKKGLSPWIIVQRPKYTPDQLFAEAKEWFIFPIPGVDLKRLSGHIPEEAIDAVEQLPYDHSFIHVYREENGMKQFEHMPPI